MQEKFVSNEVARMLAMAGFDWPVFYYYQNDPNCDAMVHNMKFVPCNYNDGKSVFIGRTSAPTLGHALQWLREERHIFISALPYMYTNKYDVYIYFCKKNKNVCIPWLQKFDKYDHAIEYALEKVLDIIINDPTAA